MQESRRFYWPTDRLIVSRESDKELLTYEEARKFADELVKQNGGTVYLMRVHVVVSATSSSVYV